MKNTTSSKSRAFRIGGFSVLLSAAVIGIAIVINLLLSSLPAAYTRYDVSANGLFSISEETMDIVRNIGEDITLYLIAENGTEDSTITERDSIVGTDPIIEGLGKEFSYYNQLNARHYAATHPEILKPVSSTAFCAMRYLSGTSAAVAYKSSSYRTFTMGIPLECISDEKTRHSIMLGILNFLTE